MKKGRIVFFLAVFSAFSILCALAPNYTLVKTGPSGSFSPLDSNSTPATFYYQWTASNNTSAGGNFFIYEDIAPGFEVLSVRGESSLSMKPSLPLSGPATLLIGPFNLAPGASVTFSVSELSQSPALKIPGKANGGDAFALLSQAQLSGNNGKLSTDAASLLEQAGTPAPTQGERVGLFQSAVAAPNISRDGQPVAFLVSLNAPAQIKLSLFSLTGEKVYSAQAPGISGTNTLLWNLQNTAGQSAASGLYIYYLEVSDGGTEQTRMGKVVILR